MNLDSLFRWASGAVALIPGLTVIISNLGVPPGMSASLYGGMIESIGALTFLLLFINKEKIKTCSLARINMTAISFFVFFIFCIISYVALYNSQVAYSEKYDISILFPFGGANELRYMIDQAGSKAKAIDNYGRQAVIDAIEKSKWTVEMTKIFFSIVYLLIFESLVISFGILGFKGAGDQ